MANRPKGYGMTREITDRINAKYDDGEEAEITSWICARTNEQKPSSGRDAFAEWLEDGRVLHLLITSFNIDAVGYNIKDVNSKKIEAMRKNMKNDNIGKFLGAAEKIGVKRVDLFQTVELVEKGNLSQVQRCLYALSSAAQAKGVGEPHIGVKHAEKNCRDFDEETQRAGRNVIGLQMGTNQVASQSGMTGYGQGRQIIHKTK